MRPASLCLLLAPALIVSAPAIPGTAGAEDAATTPTTIGQLDAVRSGETVAVSGTATFGGLAQVVLGVDGSGDAPYGSPAALGLDLTSASIGQPNPETGDLEFVLDLTDLPPTGAIPEGTWYAWDLVVDPVQGAPAGFRVSGSRTDLAGPNPTVDTNSPTFKVAPCGEGPCGIGTAVPAIMDGEANRITVTVPAARLAEIAGTSLAGATIRPSDHHFRGAAATTDPWVWTQETAPAYDRVVLAGTHTVAARAVALDLVPAGATPSFGAQATLGNDGSFAATLSTAGLGSGPHDLWARACFGTNCGTRSVRVEL